MRKWSRGKFGKKKWWSSRHYSLTFIYIRLVGVCPCYARGKIGKKKMSRGKIKKKTQMVRCKIGKKNGIKKWVEAKSAKTKIGSKKNIVLKKKWLR